MDENDHGEQEDNRQGGLPNFETWDDPETVVKGGPIRERMLDVVLQVREPTKVSTIADRADCDTETARDYLEWFADMGFVREIPGRPVRYERNESYWRWRRVQRLRQQYSEDELVAELADAMDSIAEYRERFDAERPAAVSLRGESDGESVEERWEAVSEWETLERRAALLDAARRKTGARRSDGRIDV